MSKKIGIFSGTFDPVHEGHVAFAKAALTEGGLDRVFFMVEPRPRRKQGVKALQHRQEMVKRAIAHEPGLASLIVDQNRFTVSHTLPLLQARFKSQELYFLMGDDFFEHLAHWPHVRELIESVTFAIGLRKQRVDNVKTHIVAMEKTRGLKFHYVTFKATNSDYNSRSIRLALKRGHAPEGLNSSVLRYIKQHHLYEPTAIEPR